MYSLHQAKEIIKDLVADARTRQIAVNLIGPPGIGKTAITEQVADELGIGYEVFPVATFGPGDIGGAAWRDGDSTVFLPPQRLYTLTTLWGLRKIVCFDDFTNCDPNNFGPLLRVFYERKVGEREISPDIFLCATSNRVEDQSGAVEIPKNMANRFLHLNVKPEPAEWVAWAYRKQLHPLVIAYVERVGIAALFDFEAGDLAYPSPRSVERASRLLQKYGTSGALMESLLASSCGETWAREVMAFGRLEEQLPSIAEILESPVSAKVPEDVDVLYLTISYVMSALEVSPLAMPISNALTYFTNIQMPELKVAAFKKVQQIVERRGLLNELLSVPSYVQAMRHIAGELRKYDVS